jgi:hypothetical protein
MKKYIFMAVAGMLAFSSCSNDDNEPIAQNAPQQMTFTAGFGDGAQTRATLSGYNVTFDAGDKISVFSANNNNVTFTTAAGSPSATESATFTGTATAGDPTYYAIYPHSYYIDYEREGTTIKNVLIEPDQSDASTTACGWEKESAIAYATTTGSSFTFHNACALLKITNGRGFSQNGIWIEVNEETLTGLFDLNTNDGSLAVQEGEGNNYVHADCVQSGKTIYLAVAPGTYTDFKATCDINYTEYTKSKTGSVTFAAGKIYDLGNTSAWGN